MTVTDTTKRGAWLDVAAWTSGALAVGSALLTVGHLGVGIPVLSALGPGGNRVVVPAAIAFGVATALQAAVCAGVVRRRAWAWPLGILVSTITLVGAAMPFRGSISAVGIALAAVELGALLSGAARRTLLHDAS